MAFSHLAGTTDAGAPDEIVNWFAKFEAWITGVGWTVVAGPGTTDLVLFSGGEAGGLTMLYMHVWRDGGNPSRVRMELYDDALGTHQTTNDGYVDSGGAQFAFWMSADKDAIVIVWKIGGGYRMLYGGLVMPFALSTVDETYRMVVTNSLQVDGTILHRFDGLWDQNDWIREHINMRNAAFDRLDGSFPIGGCYFGDNDEIAGQLKHISCQIMNPAVNAEDTVTTGAPGGTTTWIVLGDWRGNKFALRTGGVLPTGYPDGAHFSHVSGAAADIAEFFTALKNHMQSVGWTCTDYSGTSGRTHDWFFYSQGESGNEDIYLRVSCWGVSFWVYHSLSDGIPGAHSTTEEHANVTLADFPTQYYISADRDCLAYTINDGGSYAAVWMGLVMPFAPGLPDTTYRVCQFTYRTFTSANGRILRDHAGNWNSVSVYNPYNADGIHIYNSQPNRYDNLTYLLWPHICYQLAGPHEIIGMLKYYFFTHGGGIASLDTITVAGQTYTVFFYDMVNNNRFALRTA